jgi:hypothetical protein
MPDQTNPFLDAWAAAVVAKEVARDVLQHIEDTGEGASVNIRVIAPVSGTFPDHPLDTALRDLALATQACSHATEAACRPETPPAHAQAVGSAALLAAKALSLAESVAASPARRADPDERTRMVHAVAATAFAAARLDSPTEYQGGRQEYSTPRYPASWRRLIDTLSDAITECSTPYDGPERRHILNAAMAARDGAQAAQRAYVRLQVSNAAGPALSRFIRVASLAAAYAGCAALVPLRSSHSRERSVGQTSAPAEKHMEDYQMPENPEPEPVMESRQHAGRPGAQPVMQSHEVGEAPEADPVMESHEEGGEPKSAPVMESRRSDEGVASPGVMDSQAPPQDDPAKPVMESHKHTTGN